MVHAVDLGGVGFADLPADFCAALVADIEAKRSRAPEHPAVRASASDASVVAEIPGACEAIVVTAPLAELTAWLAGRPGGPFPPTTRTARTCPVCRPGSEPDCLTLTAGRTVTGHRPTVNSSRTTDTPVRDGRKQS